MAINLKLSIFAIFAMVTMANATPYTYSGLSYDYYKYSCPNVESISKRITGKYVGNDPTLAAALIRMDFHDCFVRGCDGSVLLDSTPENSETEKAAVPNLSLRGFEVVDAVKAALEAACPQTVSCADVLRLVARDAIVKIKGPYWGLSFGRKDGKVSRKSEASALPSPFADIETLKKSFATFNLSPKDLVVLSGAHTIGDTHCSLMQRRLYNFTGKGDTDPSLDATYATKVKQRCPPGAGSTSIPMDAYTPSKFDSKYFTTVSKNKGLFQSDGALLKDAYTKKYLELQSRTGGATFNKDFAESMIKLSNVGVLTGDQGEVRMTCNAVNSY